MSGGHALDWNDEIGDDDYKIVDSSWLEGREFHEPPIWDPVRQLTEYLRSIFEASENVGYVTASWEKDGKYLPSKGSWDRTAGELIEQLNLAAGTLGPSWATTIRRWGPGSASIPWTVRAARTKMSPIIGTPW